MTDHEQPGIIAPGWYLSPDNPKVERYWHGGAWVAGTKRRAAGAPPFPTAGAAPADPPTAPGVDTQTTPREDWLHMAAPAMWVLAGLAALAAVIGGASLMTRTGCSPNPFDPSLCEGTTHPLAGVGAAVLIGGLVQAAVFALVGMLCRIVADRPTTRA